MTRMEMLRQRRQLHRRIREAVAVRRMVAALPPLASPPPPDDEPAAPAGG